MPDSFWDAASGVKHKELLGELNRLTAFEAAEAVRKNAVPASDAYKVELPKDFQVPQGIEFTFRNDDPLMKQARDWAHANGLSQDGFSQMLSLYAGAQVADAASVTAARNAEIAKLGTTGTARVTALSTFWNAYLGDPKLGEQIMARVLTAGDVALHEKIISRLSSQGAGSFTRSHSEPPQAPGMVDEAQYQRMTAAERLDYARRFPAQGNGASR